MTRISGSSIACTQTDWLSGVSVRSSTPARALNHWRSAAIRLTRATGVRQIVRASCTMSSNCGSGGVSRTRYDSNVASREGSLTGIGHAYRLERRRAKKAADVVLVFPLHLPMATAIAALDQVHHLHRLEDHGRHRHHDYRDQLRNRRQD